MSVSSDFAEYVVEQLRVFGKTSAKGMFGGYGIYHKNLMFGLIADEVFYLKVDPKNQPAFETAGSRPFTYHGHKGKKPTVMSYWEVPVDVFEDPDELAEWAHEAYRAATRSRKKKK